MTAEKCNFCDSPATKRVHGWAEDGRDGAFVYQPVCDEHIKDFRSWIDDDGDYDDPRLHGFIYITRIVDTEAK